MRCETKPLKLRELIKAECMLLPLRHNNKNERKREEGGGARERGRERESKKVCKFFLQILALSFVCSPVIVSAYKSPLQKMAKLFKILSTKYVLGIYI